MYSRDVQTTAIETDTPPPEEDDLRERVMRDLESEREARDKEIDEESVQLDKEIEQEIRGKNLLCPCGEMLTCAIFVL